MWLLFRKNPLAELVRPTNVFFLRNATWIAAGIDTRYAGLAVLSRYWSMAEKSRFVGRVFKQQGCRTGPLRTRLGRWAGGPAHLALANHVHCHKAVNCRIQGTGGGGEGAGGHERSMAASQPVKPPRTAGEQLRSCPPDRTVPGPPPLLRYATHPLLWAIRLRQHRFALAMISNRVCRNALAGCLAKRSDPRFGSWTRSSGLRCGALARRADAVG